MKKVIVSLLVSLIAPGMLVAGDYQIAGEDKVPLEAAAAPDFETHFWIDGWIVQLNVGIANSAAGLSKSVFIGFDDIISNMDWIVPLGADFRYKRIGFMPDLVALKMSGGGATPGPFYDRANVDIKLGVLNLPAYFRLIDEPNTTLDVLAGARLLWVDMDIGLTGGPLGDTLGAASAGTDADIWDGIVGLRLEQNLSDKLFCSFYGDVGTGTSDLTWQILAGIGYRFTENFSVNTGYRYLDYDLSDENANIDLTASGIQLTFDWKF